MAMLNRSIDELLQTLQTSADGLSEQDAAARLKQYGANSLEEKRAIGDLEAFLRQFANPLVLVLLLSDGLSYFLGEIRGSIMISTLVLVSVCLQFYHERRSMQAAAALNRRVSVHATVLRNQKARAVELRQVVPGDVVLLAAGDIVPGDARLLMVKDLYVNQASLTGESFPAEKRVELRAMAEAPLADLDYVLFMGSSVVSGLARAVVVATGKNTEIGRLAHTLTLAPPLTDFERGIKEFSLMLVKVIFILVSVIFLLNAMMNKGFFESFLFAVAISVGLTPELLPLIMTVNLANGAVEMSHKGVIVKWLAAIQNFGSMDVLCSDKTGTLTEGELQLVGYQDASGNPERRLLLYAYLNSRLQSGMKNPLDLAITAVVVPEADGSFAKVDEVPFDFVRRRLSVVVAGPGGTVLIVKGAPESVFACCTHYWQDGAVKLFDATVAANARAQFEAESANGNKVIAVAYKPVDSERRNFAVADEAELIFLGLLSFFDPPKEGVAQTIADLEALGIKIKILTGDNDLISKKVCEEVGIPIERILVGTEMDKMTNEALARAVDHVSLFARLTPAQKDRVIHLLKQKGHVVGYIGDGINDAPSLRAADVGISVNNAVDVAKDAAAIILLERSLGVLKDGVLEGRRTFANTMKYIMMGASSNFGNMFSMSFASVMVPFLPMLPVQILLNNLLYDLSQIAIPADSVDKEAVARPRRWNVKFIRRFMLVFGPVSSLFDVLTFLVLVRVFRADEAAFQTGWFIESLATQILVIYVIRSRRSLFKSRPSRWLVLATLTCILFGMLLPYSPLQAFFGFVPLPAGYLAAIGGLVAAYLLLAELVKGYFRRRYGWQ